MKGIIVLFLIVSLSFSLAPAFAKESPFQKAAGMFSEIGKKGNVAPSKNNPFQKAGESVESIGRKSPVAPVNTQFQKISEDIKALGNSSLRAKALSLRGNKEGVAKRRGVK